MPIDFPNTPTLGDDYTVGTTTWTYDGTKWVLKTYNSLHAVPVGAMLDWAPSSNIPNGWMLADGTAISRTQYADLFAEIGATYGTGDGSTTFNIPNILASPGSPVTIIKATTGGAVEPSSISHAVEHVRGGSDVVDGDRVQLDWVPSNYARDSSPSEAGASTDLTAHLKGLDNRFVGYTYVTTLYYTSSGTFTKATYPWLRAIRVKCVGGGGGGGGAAITTAGQSAYATGGGGGGYAESFITNIAGLSSSVTVTVGSGGAGASAGANNGTNGNNSSFGSTVIGNGGIGGLGRTAVNFSAGACHQFGRSGGGGTGDIVITGGQSLDSRDSGLSGLAYSYPGAASFLSTPKLGGLSGAAGTNGNAGSGIGHGGGGGGNSENQGTARSGGNGAKGIVIVELYA